MEVPKQSDGLKWFGEGFDGFPKRLPEDTIEYLVCVIDDKLTEGGIRNRLKEVQTAAKSLTRSLLEDYIWQREDFRLDLVAAKDPLVPESPTAKQPPLPLSWSLRGRTNFGDSIADEWLIVYLLREISTKFPDAWIKVADNDGEFLLIEAAGAISGVLDPEVADHRVWINFGRLLYIPNESRSARGLPGTITLEEAVTHIGSSQGRLVHSKKVEAEAFARLKDYPEAITKTMHNTSLSIPRRLAYILHRKPAYISPAIDSFYVRDTTSTKLLSTKDLAELSFPPEDFVSTSVRFTRVGFAQMRAQEFPLPPAWTSVRPRMTQQAVSMGMKLTCGFEMLVRDKQNQDRREVREIKMLLEDIEEGEEQLPTDEEIKSWPQIEDDEKWLDIDFEDLTDRATRATDSRQEETDYENAEQANLRNLVSKFESFMNDEKAGVDGADDAEDEDEDGDSDVSSDVDSEGEDKDGSYNEAEFEQAMRDMMGLPQEELEKRGIMDDARKLALEMEDEEEGERDEEEEVRKITEMMERELKSRRALNLNGAKVSKETALAKTPDKHSAEAGEQDAGGMSSDDELEDNDIDLNLVKNIMESFKGQGGLSGPAGNMLASMGITLPRDEHVTSVDDED